MNKNYPWLYEGHFPQISFKVKKLYDLNLSLTMELENMCKIER
jgi:hypothetical protein